MATFEKLSVAAALELALESAEHLTSVDSAAVAAARALALKIDMQDQYFQELADLARESKSRPPSVDNVSLPTFRNYLESLGLIPSGRKAEHQMPAKPQVDTGMGKFKGMKLVN